MENFIHDRHGYCYYFIQPNKNPVIFNLYTEPDCRRQGHARRHLEYVINEIRETGHIGAIEIEVRPREDSINYENLILFYKSMGLEIIET